VCSLRRRIPPGLVSHGRDQRALQRLTQKLGHGHNRKQLQGEAGQSQRQSAQKPRVQRPSDRVCHQEKNQ